MPPDCPAEKYQNPHTECLRQCACALVALDNDLYIVQTELKTLQTKFKEELDAVEQHCVSLRKRASQRVMDPNDFTKHLRNIDEVNDLYADKVVELQKKEAEILAAAKDGLLRLNIKKCEFKKFHEKTIQHFKDLAISSTDPEMVLQIEQNICSMNSNFLHEVTYVKFTENELAAFFQKIKDSQPEEFGQECCFKEYPWIPQGKSMEPIQGFAEQLKVDNVPALKKALAMAHVHQATDVKSFVAAYLLHMEKTEEMMKEKQRLLGYRQPFTGTNECDEKKIKK